MALALWQTNLHAQAVGDYGSTGASGTTGTMNWFTGTWYKCTTAGTWAGATTTTTPPASTNNVWILAGDSVVISSTTAGTLAKCNNLEVAGKLNQVGTQVENSQCYGNLHVASTGIFYARQKYIFGNVNTAAESLTVDAGGKMLFYDQLRLQGANGYPTTITNNGILGAATAVANGSATIYILGVGNTNVIFTGSGTTIFRALLADTNAGSCNFTIDQNMTFCPASGSAAIKLQNASGVTATTARSLTINPGKIVTITTGGWFANTAAFSGVDANNTYNINGTLDVSAGSTFFGCTSNTTADQRGTINSQIINVGASGVLKLGSVVNVNKPQSGQTLAVNVTPGGQITYSGTAYQTLPTSSTFSVTASPYALLTNSNSKLNFSSASATVLTLNSDLTVGSNLTLGGVTTLGGASNLSVNGTLSLNGKLVNNTGSVILGSSASISGSSSNYIDLSAGGTLVRNGVTTSATSFPIGYGSYYTPLLLANTTGTPNITTKVKTSIDNAVQDATRIVNLQWSVVGSAASTSDVAFQFNSGNKASAFDVAGTCDLGNYTSGWTATNVGVPSGSDPYTVSSTGLSIPTTTNLYVIGNTGQVVNTAPTSSTWTGAVSNDWNTAGNWTYGVPNKTLDAIIPTSLSTYPVISVADTVKSLTVAGGASITNNGTLRITGQTISVNGALSGSGAYVLAGADVQTITGSVSVDHLVLNNVSGIVNNGSLTVNTDLNIIAGAITGTAPVYAADLPVTFTGAGTSSTGLVLNPSSGNVGTLTVNGAGTLNLSNAAQVKNLVLTAGTVNNGSNNITVTSSVTRTAGTLSTSPVYSESIPVTFNGTTATAAGYEINPASGAISTFTMSGSNTYTVANGFTTTGNINVATGTLQMSSNITAQNVTVSAGAVLNSSNTATTGSRYVLTLGNGAAGNDAVLTVDGTLGNSTKWANDGIDIQVSGNAKTFTVNGANTGGIGVSGLRPVADANARALDIFINRDIYLDRDNGGASNIEPALTLQNGTCVYDRTLSIASGATVTFRGNCAFHGTKNTNSLTDELVNNYASSTANQGNCTYIISGTLDMASSYTSTAFNLSTTSFAGNTQAVLVDVKNGGTLKLANIVKMYTALANQTSAIVAEDGSNVAFNYNAAQTNLLTGNGNVPTFNFSNLTVNNTSGISLTQPMAVRGALTLTAGSITGSPVVMSGSALQTINANGNTIENLTINNEAGVQGAPSVTGSLILAKGDVVDYSNLTNCNVVFSGTTAQTANSDLSSVKNLTINNANGVSLSGDLTVNGILTMSSGKLKLGNNNLNIWTTGSIAATPTSYVETSGTGLLVMNTPASTSTVFPVGTTSGFNPVTLNPADAGKFYVRVNEGNVPALPTGDATILPAKSLNRTWNITPSVPTTATLTFGYNGANDANASFDNSGADVALLHNNTSGNWEYVGAGAVTPGIGATTAKTATIENIGSFSPFTIANPGPGAVYVNSGGGTFSDIFRSKANGTWSSSNTWELYDAASTNWVSTVLTPTETSTVTIQAGDTVILNSQAGVGNLTIESGAKLASSVSAYTATPIVLSIGKASSIIRNNGLFGCAKGSAAGTVGDGITLSLAPNCVSFQLTGTGETGIGSLYAEAGSNNLTAVIDQDVQFRRTTVSGKQVALSMIAPSGTAFNGSRTLLIKEGKTVSFQNEYSCLHGTAFSSAGSNAEQQGNIIYDIQGTLDLKGGNVYITSSADVAASAQTVKLNIGTKGKLVVAGDFNLCKVQATQTVYVNVENGGLLDASGAPLAKTNFYGPSTNATSGYGSNYVWVVMGDINASYNRMCGTGGNTKVFNIAVAPTSGDYANIYGNPVSLSTTSTVFTDVYSTGVAVGNFPANYSYSTNYALNRTWKIEPSRGAKAYPTYMYYGFTGGSVDANSAYSLTYPSYTAWYGTTINAGATDLYMYNNLTSRWAILSFTNNIAPVSGTMGTTWQMKFNPVAGFVAPYYFNLFNMAVPLNCY